MDTQSRGFEVRRTRLGAGDVRFHIAANASPDIDLVGHINRQQIVSVRGRGGVCYSRAVLGLTHTGGCGSARDSWVEGGTRHADSRAGAAQLRLGDRERLVGDIDLLFEGVQLGILEDLPPLPTRCLIVGLRRFPAVRGLKTRRWQLFIGGWHLYLWALILRANSASGDRQQ